MAASTPNQHGPSAATLATNTAAAATSTLSNAPSSLSIAAGADSAIPVLPSDAGLTDGLLRPAVSAVAQQPQRLLPAAAYATATRRDGRRFVHVPQGGQRRPLPRYEHAAAMTNDGRLVVVGGNHGGWVCVHRIRPLRC